MAQTSVLTLPSTSHFNGGGGSGAVSSSSTAGTMPSVAGSWPTSMSTHPEGSGSPPPAEMDPWDLAVEQENQLQKQRNKIGLIVNDRYQIESKIGVGSFGSIFQAKDLRSGRKVAVKFEVESDSEKSHLFYEQNIYQGLAKAADAATAATPSGVPSVYWYGQQFGYNLLVLDLLGPNLEQLLNFCDGRFSLRTVVNLADQMIKRLQHIHEAGYVHRDIKPANFLAGVGERQSDIFLIDYGLAKRWRHTDPDTLRTEHMASRNGRNLVGTARYASANAHIGQEISRRDDLESIGYLLVAFLKGKLPWTDVKGRTKKQKYANIKRLKCNTSPEKLCAGLPRQFVDYLRYCRQLAFDAQPDYSYCLGLFKGISCPPPPLPSAPPQACLAASAAQRRPPHGFSQNGSLFCGGGGQGPRLEQPILESSPGRAPPLVSFDWQILLAASQEKQYQWEVLFKWASPSIGQQQQEVANGAGGVLNANGKGGETPTSASEHSHSGGGSSSFMESGWDSGR